MLADSLITEIRKMLDSGAMSQREIARRLKVSRGTVGAVALGKRKAAIERTATAARAAFKHPRGMPIRCPSCGAKTQMPCLACYVRKFLASRKEEKRSVIGGQLSAKRSR